MRVRTSKMACCCSSRAQTDHSKDLILDVEKILQDFVWKAYKDSRSSWQNMCLRRKDFIVDVPMNYFHFDKIHEDVRPRQRAVPHTAAAAAVASSANPSQRPPTLTQSMTHMGRDVTHNPWLTSNNAMALSTDFTNSTDKEQTYSFRFEKTRKAALNVTFQKGFTVGGKVNFSLGLPKTIADTKVGAEVDMHLTVSKATGETIEETLVWTASSEIKVADKSNYTLKVLLSEAPVSYSFELLTKMSMPSGGAPVTVTRKKGGDTTYTMVIESLKPVFEGYLKIVDHFVLEASDDESVYHSVVLKTSGIVDGIRLSDQKILLESRPLNRRSSSSSSSLPQGPAPQGSAVHNNVSQSDCYSGSLMAAPTRAGMLTSSSSTSQHSPSPSPIMEEVPEEDGEVEGGGGGGGGGSGNPSSPPVHLHARGPPGGVAGGHQVPRITTTAPSSLASSPLSDTGSPDMSESSKKSQTVTTV